MTTITSGPPSRWGRGVARIDWTVEDAAATTTECRLDDGEWFACAGGESLEGLQEGDHVFRVRSTDQYGNAEDPGAERRFVVDRPAAANDHFAAAAVLAPGSPVTVNNGKASAESGEPAHDSWYYEQGLSAAFSVWFTFTPVADATAELDWCASEVDVVAAVYTGTSVRSVKRVDAWGEDQCRGSFRVRRGVAYHLAVDGFARNRDYGTGPITVGLAYRDVAPQDPGTGSTTAPPPTLPVPHGEPVAAASLRLAPSGRLSAQVNKQGRFSVAGARLHCASTTECLVRVQVRTRRSGGRRIGGATLAINPDASRGLAARLERAARTRLARHGRTRAWIRVALGDGSTVIRRITLLAPRRRHSFRVRRSQVTSMQLARHRPES